MDDVMPRWLPILTLVNLDQNRIQLLSKQILQEIPAPNPQKLIEESPNKSIKIIITTIIFGLDHLNDGPNFLQNLDILNTDIRFIVLFLFDIFTLPDWVLVLCYFKFRVFYSFILFLMLACVLCYSELFER